MDSDVFALFSQSNPENYFRSFECGLPSYERNKRWIMALKTYIDASGMGGIDRDPHLVLAGFIGVANKWAEFEDIWQAELANPPAIKYFKLNEAFYPKHNSQFVGWDKIDINHKINRLINIIKSIKPLGRVVSYIDKKEFEQLIIKSSPKHRADNPYQLCFIHLINGMVASQHKSKSKYKVPIDFIFDEEGEIGYDCAKWINYFKKTIIPKYALHYFGSITFGDDKRIVALQAADLYSGLYRRHLFENKALYIPMSKELKLLQAIPAIFDEKASLKEISIWMQNDKIRQIDDKLKRIKENPPSD